MGRLVLEMGLLLVCLRYRATIKSNSNTILIDPSLFQKDIQQHELQKLAFNAKTKMFECKTCKKSFKAVFDLWQHVKNPPKLHFSEEHFENRFFNTKYKTFDCAWCDKKFNLLQEFKQHFTTSHPEEKLFCCRLCYKIPGKYPCKKCPKVFSCQNSLDVHFKTVHAKHFFEKIVTEDKAFNAKTNKFECEICKKSYIGCLNT